MENEIPQLIDNIKERLNEADKILAENPDFSSEYDIPQQQVDFCIKQSFIETLYLFEKLNLTKTYEQLNNVYAKAQKAGFRKAKSFDDRFYLVWSVELRSYLSLIEDIILTNRFTTQDARELGRLRTEKSKWDDSIKASVKIGIFCAELLEKKIEITRAMLTDKIYKLGFKKLSNTTINKIWKAIPDKYKKKAGRPRNNKDT